MRTIVAGLALVGLAAVPAGGAGAGPPATPPDPARLWLIPPVDGAIGARFDAPDGPYGSGHRGIDYVVPSGTSVRAAGDGWVRFAGSVPGGLAVTIEHTGGMETTYSLLARTDVSAGDFVAQGHWIGRTRRAHGGAGGGLHFGVRIEGAYVDPLSVLGPLDVAGAIRLAPLERGHGPPTGARRECRRVPGHSTAPEAPSDNIAVVVPGISSKTSAGAEVDVRATAAALGYRPEAVYTFSYAGPDGPRFHEPYDRADTYAALDAAAGRLTALMLRIAAAHPGRSVDLIAHSQGGLIARTYLARSVRAWQRGVPRVDHLVTFSTPHHGTEAADLAAGLKGASYGGRALVELADVGSRAGLPIPDPDSRALRDLGTDSDLVASLARQDVLFGTRVLSLATPDDLAVPAPRALYHRDRTAVVPSAGILRSHSSILGSGEAIALAHHFLRDGAPACGEGYAGAGLGTRMIGWHQRLVPYLVRRSERLFMRRAPIPGS